MIGADGNYTSGLHQGSGITHTHMSPQPIHNSVVKTDIHDLERLVSTHADSVCVFELSWDRK